VIDIIKNATCRVCNNTYPYNLVYFVKRVKGLEYVCLNCEEEESIRYRNNQIKEKEYQKEFNKIKPEILKRDGYKCTLCESTIKLHVHHIVSRKDEGQNNKENLITVCKECHLMLHEDSPHIVRFMSKL
jgi:5-methylcytosine-specific restriction endonuclease McrA